MMSKNDAGEAEMSGLVRGAVFAGLAAIEAALLYKLIWGQVSANSTELITAICLIGILLLLTGTLEGLKSISFGKEGFKAEIERLEKRTATLEREIAHLTLSSMGDDAYFNLRKLARGDFGPYRLEEQIGLYTELYHLRNLGFVALKKERPSSVKSIRDIPPDGDQLSEFIEVTETGKQYMALRRRSDALRE